MELLIKIRSNDAPFSLAHIPESNCFFGWKVNDNESIHAGITALAQESLLSVCANGIIITHQ